MGRVIWSPSALEDADAIAAFIARDSAIARLCSSRAFLKRRIESRLIPTLDGIIPELNDTNRREVFVGPYRLMYREEGEDIWIVAVVHGARDWPNPPRWWWPHE